VEQLKVLQNLRMHDLVLPQVSSRWGDQMHTYNGDTARLTLVRIFFALIVLRVSTEQACVFRVCVTRRVPQRKVSQYGYKKLIHTSRNSYMLKRASSLEKFL
jgi:hypothetical protein